MTTGSLRVRHPLTVDPFDSQLLESSPLRVEKRSKKAEMTQEILLVPHRVNHALIRLLGRSGPLSTP